jgi:hypothetical protein
MCLHDSIRESISILLHIQSKLDQFFLIREFAEIFNDMQKEVLVVNIRLGSE